MTEDAFRQFLVLVNDREAKYYAYLRQLLVLSSGSLAAMVSFRADAHSLGMALLFLRTGWAALGLGILLGSLALHGEVWTAAELVRLARESVTAPPSPGGARPSPVAAKLPERYQRYARGCYASLLVAVVALVAHTMVRD